MKTCQQLFEEWLTSNHKEAIENLIRQRIDEAKSLPYYKSWKSPVPYDSSLRPYGTGETIGERCKEDFQILCAFTGDTSATYASGHGLCCITIGDEIEDEVSRKIADLACLFVADNYEVVYRELSEVANIEKGISAKELADKAIYRYVIVMVSFICLETFNSHEGLLATLLNRCDLYSDWLEYEAE